MIEKLNIQKNKQAGKLQRLERHVVKVGQDNPHPLPSTTNCCKALMCSAWSADAIEPSLSLFKLSLFKFCQLLSNLVATLQRLSQTMEKERTKDLNIMDRADLKK